jgi:hypothetical protein
MGHGGLTPHTPELKIGTIENIDLCCITSQKSKYLIYTVVEAY